MIRHFICWVYSIGIRSLVGRLKESIENRPRKWKKLTSKLFILKINLSHPYYERKIYELFISMTLFNILFSY